MKANYMTLNKILDLKKWQSLQDSLAKVTKMAIITVDYKGIPITWHSDPRPFCKAVRSDPNLEKYCHKCDSRAGLEAVRTNAPYIYLCHCNIMDTATPISVDGQYIGAVMAGQVRLPENESYDLEQILVSPASASFGSAQLQRMYEDIPILSYREIETATLMLYDLCNYIVEEAINKNLILEMYEKMPQRRESASDVSLPHGHSLNNIEDLKKELGNVVINAYVKTSLENQTICKNPILKPAFDYIYNNKGENISQKKMADLCYVSTGHFSRLFVKETGETFSVFLARQKVEFSKQLLEKTDLHITQISDELGFSSSGYYIKTFKKYESITPATYRKYFHVNQEQKRETNIILEKI